MKTILGQNKRIPVPAVIGNVMFCLTFIKGHPIYSNKGDRAKSH